MIMKNDKWEMFKNYMHNELGITKDDIRGWIKEAAEEQAQRLVAQEFGSFNIQSKITEIIKREFNDRYSGYSGIRTDLIKEIASKLTLVEK